MNKDRAGKAAMLLAAAAIDRHVTTDDLEQFGDDAPKVNAALNVLVEELRRRAGYLLTSDAYRTEAPRPTLTQRVEAAEEIIAALVDAGGPMADRAAELLAAYDRRYTTQLADRQLDI